MTICKGGGGCTRQARYNLEGLKALFCSTHKTAVMVDVNSKRCEDPHCKKGPSFGFDGGKPRFCKDHKQEGMVDTKTRKCEQPGCRKRPSFSMEGQPKRFCKDHSTTDMVDTANRRCDHPGCKKQPNFNWDGRPALFCASHKVEGMVNTTSRRCEHPNCLTSPLFGYEGQPPRFCKDHSKAGMVDTVNRRCEHDGCRVQPSFAFPGEQRRFCEAHMQEGMINVVGRRCEHLGCLVAPSFAFEGQLPRVCKAHRTPGMIDTANPRCKSGCGATANPDRQTYEGSCVTCFYNQYPDKRDWSSSVYIFERRTIKELRIMEEEKLISNIKTQARLDNVEAYDGSACRSAKPSYTHMWVDVTFDYTDNEGSSRTCAIEVDGGQHTRIDDADAFYRGRRSSEALSEDSEGANQTGHVGGALGLNYDRDLSKEQRLLDDGVSIFRLSTAGGPTAEKWRTWVRAAVEQCRQGSGPPIFVTHPKREYTRMHEWADQELAAVAPASAPPAVPDWRRDMLQLKGIEQPRPRKRRSHGKSSSAVAGPPSPTALRGRSSSSSPSQSAFTNPPQPPAGSASSPPALASILVASSPDEAAATSSKKRRRIIEIEDTDDEE